MMKWSGHKEEARTPAPGEESQGGATSEARIPPSECIVKGLQFTAFLEMYPTGKVVVIESPLFFRGLAYLDAKRARELSKVVRVILKALE